MARKAANVVSPVVKPVEVADLKNPLIRDFVAPEAFELSPEEMQAILKLREARTESILNSTGGGDRTEAINDIAQALIAAINATKSPEKKTPFNRKKGDPWQPKPGQVKPKLKRVIYQHGVELNPAQLSVEEVELLNKIKVGSYCGGHIRVLKRKDRSYDIDYPIRTASQRLKLVNQFQIVSLKSLLQRLVDEASDPARYKGPEDDNED